jgi:hypothetical protein
MSRSQHEEAYMIGALREGKANRKAEDVTRGYCSASAFCFERKR